MLEYLGNVKPSIEKGNTDPYIYDEFLNDIKLSAYDYDYMLQKELIDYHEEEFVPDYEKSYIGIDIIGVPKSGELHSYNRVIEYTIQHRFIIQGEMENFKKSPIYGKYLTTESISSNIHYFHYNLLVYIDDEIYTDFVIKPTSENVTIYFKTTDLNLIHKRHNSNTTIKDMPNKIKILFLPNSIISILPNLNTSNTSGKSINIANNQNLDKFKKISKFLVLFSHKTTGANFLYTVKDFNTETNIISTVDNIPGSINNYKAIIIGMNEIRSIVNIPINTTWFQLPDEKMPIPKTNIMIFIKKGTADSYIPNNNTVELTEYYPNIYKITNPNNYPLRLILLYEEKEENNHIVYDDVIRLYKDKVDLLAQYKNNNVPKAISEYKPISWDYSYDDLYQKISGYPKLSLANFNKTNAYKTDIISNITKKWYKFYDEYQRRTYSGFLVGWYHKISNYTSTQLTNKTRSSYKTDFPDLLENDFTEDQYLFTYKNKDNDLDLFHLYYIDGKLVFPTKKLVNNNIYYVYFPKRLLTSNSVLEVERFDGVNFKKNVKFTKGTTKKASITFKLSDFIKKPIIANSLFLVRDNGDFIDYSRYDAVINDEKLGAINLDLRSSTYKIYPTQTIHLYTKENDESLYNLNLLFCCNNKIYYYEETEDGTFFTTGKADKVNLNKNHGICEVKQDVGRRLRIYDSSGRLIPKRGYTVYKSDNFYDGPTFNVVIHGDKTETFTVVYVGYDEKLIYHRDNLPLNGLVSIEGRTSRPLSFAYHDLYLDGYKLTKYDIEQISPFKFIIKNYAKYKTNVALEIYEKSTPSDSYIKYKYNEFSDYPMDQLLDDEERNINKSDIKDSNIKNKMINDKVNFKDIIEASLTEYNTNYPNDVIDSIHDDYMDFLRYYAVYKYMNGDKRVDLEAFYHIFNDIGRAVLNADDRIKYSDDVKMLYYLNHNKVISDIGNNLDNYKAPKRDLTSEAVILDDSIIVDESIYMDKGYIDNNFTPVYNEPFIPPEKDITRPIKLTPQPIYSNRNIYKSLENYPIVNKVNIRKKTISKPTLLTEEIYYSGNEETVILVGYNSDFMILGGVYSETKITPNKSYYRASVKPKTGYVWEDSNTSETLYFNWRIIRRPLYTSDIPRPLEVLNYNGKNQSPRWNNYDETLFTIGGETSGTEIKVYTATFKPTDNCYWADGTTESKPSNWEIADLNLIVPKVIGTYTYTSQNQVVNLDDNYDSTKMVLDGDYTALDAGDYSFDVNLLGDYIWSTNTPTKNFKLKSIANKSIGNKANNLNFTINNLLSVDEPVVDREPKTLEWTIARKKVSSEILPVQINTLQYIPDLPQLPIWSEYNKEEFEIIDCNPEIYPSTGNGYIARFIPTKNYCWSDGTFGAIPIYWNINAIEINSEISIYKNFDYDGENHIVTVNGFDSNKMMLTGDIIKTDAGTYTVSVTPLYGYMWDDTKDRTSKNLTWTIYRKKVSTDKLPRQTNSLIYNTRTQEPTWSAYNEDEIEIGGVLKASQLNDNPGYAATFTPTNNYCWSDGTYEPRIVYWTINPYMIGVPYQNSIYDYSGGEQTVTLALFNENTMIMDGETTATDAGTYTVYITPRSGYIWIDTKTSTTREINWIIRRRPLISSKLPLQINDLTYIEDTEQEVEWSQYNTVELEVGGVVKAINAGNHIATFTPTENYCWFDRTTSPKEVTWIIKRKPFDVDYIPEQAVELFYIEDTKQYPTWTTFSVLKLKIGGTLVGIDAKNDYLTLFTPTSNYCWQNKSIDPRGMHWSIRRQRMELIELPTQSNILYYKENTEQEPEWTEYNKVKLDISGITIGKNSGIYEAIFTPTSNYCWTDDSIEGKLVKWKINRQPMEDSELPTQENTLVYTEGLKQGVTWTTYNSIKLSVSGVLENIDAGIYEAIFTPTSNYCWSDDSIKGKVVKWKINRQPMENSELPTQAIELNYEENIEQSVTWTTYNSIKLSVSGVLKGINADTYEAIFTPTSNYCWSDGSIEGKVVKWTIIENKIAVPYQINIPTYNGKNHTVELANFDSHTMEIVSGDNETNAGSHNVVIAPKTGYRWEDTKNRQPRNISWIIKRKKLDSDTLPTQKEILHYTGEVLSVTWTDYDREKLQVGGVQSATMPTEPNSDGYAATFTPTNNYCWTDGTYSARTVYWRIDFGNILDVPYQINIPTYEKDITRAVELDLYNPNTMNLTGELTAVNAGTHYLTVTPKYGFVWEDTQQAENRVIIWLIYRKTITESLPHQTNTLIYNGELQEPEWSQYDDTMFSIGGVLKARYANSDNANGGYEATFTPTENYCWPDKTYDYKPAYWKINRKPIENDNLPEQINTIIYDGDAQYPEWSSYNEDFIIIGGELSGVDAKKDYKATFVPIDNYCWSDGGFKEKTVNWEIKRRPFDSDDLPYQLEIPTYTGSPLTATWSEYDEKKLKAGGTLSATDVSENTYYTATFTPTDNYTWSNGGIEPREVYWKIDPAVSDVPYQINIPTYDGNEHTVELENFNPEYMVLTGNITKTDAGTYTALVNPTNNYCWADTKISNTRIIIWEIYRQELGNIPLPSQKIPLTYNGEDQHVTWTDYDVNKLVVTGTQLATNANKYTAIFTPGDNYCWNLKTEGSGDKEKKVPVIDSKTVQWEIQRKPVDSDQLPHQTNDLTYNGTTQYPTWSEYDSDHIKLEGVTFSDNASKGSGHEAKFTPIENYCWSDGSYNSRSVFWVIKRLAFDSDALPQQKLPIYHKKKLQQNVTWTDYDTDKLKPGGTLNATEPGTYTATFTPTDNYTWSNGGIEGRSVEWKIFEALLEAVGEYVYDGTPKTVTIKGFYDEYMTISQNTYTEAGKYEAIIAWKDPTINWADTQDNEPKHIEWEIFRQPLGDIELPEITSELTYNTQEQEVTYTPYDEIKLQIGGTLRATNAKNDYKITFTPTANYCWGNVASEEPDIKAREVQWEIKRKIVSIEILPEQPEDEILRYNGTTLSPGWTNLLDPNEIDFIGEQSHEKAGDHTAKFKPNDNHCWSDGSYNERSSVWKIYRAFVYENELPKQSMDVIPFYDGEEHEVVWTTYDQNKFKVSGTTKAKEPATGRGYAAVFTPTENYYWEDESTEGKIRYWKIFVSRLIQINIPTYNGSEHIVELSGFNPEIMIMGGTYKATNAGTYTVTVSLIQGHIWSDTGESSPRDIEWEIYKKQLGENYIIEQNNTLYYNGNSQSPEWTYYDTTKIDTGGTLSGIDAGKYTATFTPKNNYCWYDKTEGTKSVEWEIKRQRLSSTISLPEQTNYLTYNGAAQSPTWSSYDESKLEITGTTSAVDASTTHAVSFAPTKNYAWSNGTFSGKTVYWAIHKKKLANNEVPEQDGICVYDGTVKSPTWKNYDDKIFRIYGTTSAVEVSNGRGYMVTFAPTSNYLWPDGTATPKTVYWVLEAGKLQSVFVVSEYTYNGTQQTVQLTGFDSTYMTVSGENKATNAGKYKFTISLIYGYVWSENGKNDDLELEWEIKRQPLSSDTLPYQTNILAYKSGVSQSPTWSSYDENKLSLSGELSGEVPKPDPGYTVTFTPTDNYSWPDGSFGGRQTHWNIGRIKLDSDDLPEQTNDLTYNGSPQSPTWSYYDENKLKIVGGTTSATNASMGFGYAVSFAPTEGYTWTDGTTNPRTVNWTIKKAPGKIRFSIINEDTGEIQEVEIIEEIAGKLKLRNMRLTTKANTVTLHEGDPIFVSSPRLLLRVGSSGPVNIEDTDKTILEIKAGTISEIPEQFGSLIYNGEEQSVVWDENFNEANMYVTGQITGIDAGTYTAIINARNGWEFSDGTTTKNVDWYIDKADGIIEIDIEDEEIELTETENSIEITVHSTGECTAVVMNENIATIEEKIVEILPTQKGSITYNTYLHEPEWNNFDTNKLSISGEVSGTDARTYTAIFTTINGYKFSDKTNRKEVQWSIDKAIISEVPTQNGTINYSGKSETPYWNNYDSTQLIISGDTSGINVDTYTAIFTPTSNYKWFDGTITGKTSNWVIIDNEVNVPEQAIVLKYTGSTQYVTWDNNYDETKMSVSGQTNAIDVGTYTTTFTCIGLWKFTDGTKTKDVQWSINKADGQIELSCGDSIELTEDNDTLEIIVYSTGECTANISNTSIVNLVQYVNIPVYSGNLTYNGETQTPTFTNYDNSKVNISGDISGINAGTYNAIFTLNDGYYWTDKTKDPKTVQWSINKADGQIELSCGDSIELSMSNKTIIITAYGTGELSAVSSNPNIATVVEIIDSPEYTDGVLEWSGEEQQPTWNFIPSKVTRSGTIKASSVGNYSTTFTLPNGCMWDDDTTSSKTIQWSIIKKELVINQEDIEIKQEIVIDETTNELKDATTVAIKSEDSIKVVNNDPDGFEVTPL